MAMAGSISFCCRNASHTLESVRLAPSKHIPDSFEHLDHANLCDWAVLATLAKAAYLDDKLHPTATPPQAKRYQGDGNRQVLGISQAPTLLSQASLVSFDPGIAHAPALRSPPLGSTTNCLENKGLLTILDNNDLLLEDQGSSFTFASAD